MNNCCYNCEKREVGCHSGCEAYKKFRAEMDEISKKRMHENDVQNMLLTKAKVWKDYWFSKKIK